MKIIRLPNGRRINLEQLALWRVEGGSITAMLSGHGQLIEVVSGIEPAKWAGWIARLMDQAAVSKETGALIDVGQLLKDFENGAYVSEDLDTSKP